MKWLPTLISGMAVLLVLGTIRLWSRMVAKAGGVQASSDEMLREDADERFEEDRQGGCGRDEDDWSEEPEEDWTAPRPVAARQVATVAPAPKQRIPLLPILFTVFNAIVLVGGCVAACGLFWWLASRGVVEGRNVVHAITPDFGWFIVPGIVVGLSLSFVVYSGCAAVGILWQGKERRQQRLAAMGGGGALAGLILFFDLIGMVAEIFLTLSANSYLLATPDGVVVSRAWSLKETCYAYGDVQAVEVRQFRVKSRQIPIFTIAFADGWQWSSQGWLKDVNPDNLEHHRQFASFVAEMATIPVKQCD